MINFPNFYIILQTRPEGSTFLADLQQTLMVPQNEESVLGTRYDVPLINSVVFYVAMQVIFILYSWLESFYIMWR